MRATEKLHDRLLPETLRRAAAIEFYAARWGTIDEEDARRAPWQTLRRLPSMDKSTYRESPHRVLVAGAAPTSVVHSTGTTGRPLLRYRGADEVAAQQRLVDGRRPAGAPPRLMFTCLAGFVHGGRSGVRLADVEMQLSLGSPAGLERALDLLTNPDLLPGTGSHQRVLAGTPVDLALLTGAMLERFGSTEPANLDVLVNLTDMLPASTREFYEKTWAPTRLVNRFSMSEIVGGATQQADDSLRFDPTVVVETLALDGDEPVEQGIAELTLTELYPFSQVQPFIRYRTGDLVSVRPSPEGSSLRLLGRLAMTPVLAGGRGQVLLGIVGLRSRLDAEPALAREEMPDHVPGAAGLGGVLGEWELDESGPTPVLTVRVATTANRYMFAAAAYELKARVENHVRAEMAAVGAEDAAQVNVEVVSWAGLETLGSRPRVWTDQADRAVVGQPG